MKQLINGLLTMLFVGLLFFGCRDSQSVEPASDAQYLSKGIPADGNGNKYVESDDFTFDIECSTGQILNVHYVYWFQFKVFGEPNNRNIDLAVFHLVLTYTNGNGDKFVWHDVGPDHYYMVGDEIFVSITGRSTASGNIDRTDINVGHVVLNETTGELVFEAGRNLGNIDELACSELSLP